MKARKVPLRRQVPSVLENSLNSIKAKPLPAVSPSPLNFRPKDILFLQIIASSLVGVPFVDLTQKYGVQDLAPRGRRGPEEGIPYLLGSGTSCHVVQHETGEDTIHIVPKGSLVALKLYRQEGVDYSAPSAVASRELAQVIWQDIRVFCHPFLRDHENLCKLLYIAWEPYSLVPVLALELATFGSLEDAIQSESDLSPTQKANISMDIATGLCALHDCGFIHGDIKPSNVMLQEHGQRQILAKLLDFSGVTDLPHYGTTGHKSYMTKIWLAPEVLLGSGNIVWEKVDVYAYGLVLTHMWSYKDLDLTEIFLETSLPSHLSSAEKHDFFLYYKCCEDTENASVLRQAIRTVVDPSINDEDRYEILPLGALIRSALVRDPSARTSMSQMMLSFREFAIAEGRDLPRPGKLAEVQDAETQQWAGTSDRNLFVFAHSFTKRSQTHQQITLNHMKVVSKEPMLDQTPLLAGSDEDFEDPRKLRMLVLQNDGALNQVDDTEHYCRVLHYQIAACLLEGRGSKVDDVGALAYLASAALGGIKRAMYMLHRLESYTALRLPYDIPRRLFLVLGHLNGCSEASDSLRMLDPESFNTAQVLNNVIHWTELADDCSFLRVVLPPNSEVVRGGNPGTSLDIRSRKGNVELFKAIEDGNVLELKYLLAQGADPNARNHCGMSPLHALSLTADEAAVQMVDSLVQAGARMEYEFMESFAYWKNRICHGRGTPLAWSIVKNKALFFECLLKVGSTLETSGYRYPALTFILLVSLRRYQMLETIAKFPNSINDVLNGPMSLEILNQAMLSCIENYTDGNSIGRRWSLGQEFDTARERTIHHLLSLGGNPLNTNPGSNRSPLTYAILQGDAVCVKAFVEHLRREGADVATLMSRNGVLKSERGAGQTPTFWSAIRGSLEAPCRGAFIYLLNEFQSTIDQLSSKGWSPLGHAASKGDTFAVDELLKHGAAFQPTQRGSSPLVNALCIGSTEIAATVLNDFGKEKLLGPNPLSDGHNAFSLVLREFMAGHRHISLSSFEFLREVGGLSFITNGMKHETAFQVFFRGGRPSYHMHRSADLGLLRFLLQDNVFRTRVDQVSAIGLGAIHDTAIHTYTEAAELLLERGADVNLTTRAPIVETKNRHITVGQTALDLAIDSYIHGAPNEIKIGGSTEIRAWKLRLEALVRLLVDHGGENSNSVSELYPMHVQKILDPHGMRHLHLQYTMNPTPGEEIWRGAWPKQLPRCPRIRRRNPNDEFDVDAVPNQQTAASDANPRTILQNRSVIYRTRKGKKIKTTEFMLSLIGPVLESESEEESEQGREHKQNQLRHARAVIEARIAEEAMGEVSLGK